MQAKIENNELVIRIPLEKPKPSSSGKTLIVASTGGNTQTDVEVNGKPVFTFPELFLERNIIFSCLVEAPGLEPGSEKGPSEASTSVAYILFLGPLAPAGGIHWPQSARWSPTVDGPNMSGKPALVTPVSAHAGSERADARS